MSSVAGSAVRRPRDATAVRVLWLAAAVVVLLLVTAASLMLGTQSYTPAQVWHALTADAGTTTTVVSSLRLPRTVLGLLAGAALAVAGALMQGLTRNPLADPGILGVNAGAGVAVAVMVGGLHVLDPRAHVLAAAVGALVATVVVTMIGASGRGPLDPARLVLGGVAVSAVLGGVSSMLVLLDPKAFEGMRSWAAGSISVDGWQRLSVAGPVLLVALLLAVALAAPLNLVAMGDEVATALGVRLGLVRALTVVAITLLCAGTVAAAGPIGFVGLIAPHVVRAVVGTDHGLVLLGSLLAGPVMVLAADVVGRFLVRPAEMPAGIVTAFVGALLLVALVRRRPSDDAGVR